METIIEIFLEFCAWFGYGIICMVVYSAMANGIDSFKRRRNERKKKKLPEPLATLVAIDDDITKYYICIKCPKDGIHLPRLLRYLDISEYDAARRCNDKGGK